MRVSYICWLPWFGLQAPNLDLDDRCHVTTGLSGVFEADVVAVHVPSVLSGRQGAEIGKLRANAPRRQVWLFVSQESFANYPLLEDGCFGSLFDGEMSHRQSADIWIPYFDHDAPAGYAGVNMGRRADLCCAFVSSSFNKSGREHYLAELMRHIDIASYGRFLNNRSLPLDRGRATKIAVMRRFRYTIAFENSIERDYVTEKFFDPLSAGTIPVYLGAPNVGEFYPGDGCCINVSHYPDPRELARKFLEADPQDFHRWRGQPLNGSFRDKLDRLSAPLSERFVLAVERIRLRKQERPSA